MHLNALTGLLGSINLHGIKLHSLKYPPSTPAYYADYYANIFDAGLEPMMVNGSSKCRQFLHSYLCI